MSTRPVTLTLTPAEQSALLFAIAERSLSLEDRVESGERGEAGRELKALMRAKEKLVIACHH